MHVMTRFSSEFQAFRAWLKSSSDDALYLSLQYIRKIFPSNKFPDFNSKTSVDLDHQAESGDPEKNAPAHQRHDAPMRDNLIRFKKGKRLKR